MDYYFSNVNPYFLVSVKSELKFSQWASVLVNISVSREAAAEEQMENLEH